MDKIFIFFNTIFSIEWQLQKKLMSFSNKNKLMIEKINLTLDKIFYSLAAFFALSVLYETSKSSSLATTAISWIFIGYIFIYFILKFMLESLFIFTTLRGFLTSGLMAASVIFIMLFALFEKIISNNILIGNYFSYFLLIFVLVVVWFFFSTFCNAEVATLANAILSVIVGVTLQVNSFFWSILTLEGRQFFTESELKTLAEFGYGQVDVITMAMELILFPIFVMLTLGTLSCALKGYWIKKYNNGKDIIY